MDFIDDDMRDIGKHSIALQPPQQNTSGAKSETCRAGYFRIQSDVVPDKRTITPDAVFFAELRPILSESDFGSSPKRPSLGRSDSEAIG